MGVGAWGMKFTAPALARAQQVHPSCETPPPWLLLTHRGGESRCLVLAQPGAQAISFRHVLSTKHLEVSSQLPLAVKYSADYEVQACAHACTHVMQWQKELGMKQDVGEVTDSPIWRRKI